VVLRRRGAGLIRDSAIHAWYLAENVRSRVSKRGAPVPTMIVLVNLKEDVAPE
jgi:hypothetical protein